MPWSLDITKYRTLTSEEISKDGWPIDSSVLTVVLKAGGLLRVRNSARVNRRLRTGDFIVGIPTGLAAQNAFRVGVAAQDLCDSGAFDPAEDTFVNEGVSWARFYVFPTLSENAHADPLFA